MSNSNCFWRNHDFRFHFFLNVWCVDLNNRDITSKIIKIYLCDVRSIYINKNYSNFFVFEHSMLNRIVYDIKRVRNNKIFKKRKSIIKNVLLKILNIFDVLIRQKITLHAFFCLIFVVFFRIDEFTWFFDDREIENFVQWRVIKTSMIFLFHNLKFTLFFFQSPFF